MANLPTFTEDEITQAVALFYDGNNAPTVTAKGAGEQGEEIIKIAQECGVPLCQNAPLVELLAMLELGDSIPESLYLTIAHVIAFAYKVKMDVEDAVL